MSLTYRDTITDYVTRVAINNTLLPQIVLRVACADHL